MATIASGSPAAGVAVLAPAGPEIEAVGLVSRVPGRETGGIGMPAAARVERATANSQRRKS
jgi:hypothetical protein